MPKPFIVKKAVKPKPLPKPSGDLLSSTNIDEYDLGLLRSADYFIVVKPLPHYTAGKRDFATEKFRTFPEAFKKFQEDVRRSWISGHDPKYDMARPLPKKRYEEFLKLSNVVDLSRYSPAEREIIGIVTERKDRPLTQEEINLALEQARAIFGDDLTG